MKPKLIEQKGIYHFKIDINRIIVIHGVPFYHRLVLRYSANILDDRFVRSHSWAQLALQTFLIDLNSLMIMNVMIASIKKMFLRSYHFLQF